MHRGWVKLFRKRLDSGVLRNHRLNAFQDWCLLKATHRPTTQMIGYQKVVLDPGQFVFGRNAAAEELGMPPSAVYRCLRASIAARFADIQANNRYSIISIVNWHLFQDPKAESEQPDE